MTIRISLCMIVRDEAEFILDCLESAREAVDEMIVVDTGSTDSTVELAQRAGASVYPFVWCDDFAAARNASIDHSTGDWVLWLDADERLAPGGAEVLREAVQNQGFDCAYLYLHDAARLNADCPEVLSGRARLTSPIVQPRLLRRTPDLRFAGVIHERLDDWLWPRLRALRTQTLPAHVIHLGYAPEVREGRDKGRRNVRLLEKLLALEPGDCATWGYLAQEQYALGQTDQAWEAAEAGWHALEQADPARRQLALLLACVRAQLQLSRGDAGGALDTIEVAEQAMGAHPDLDLVRGLGLLTTAVRTTEPTAHRRALEGAEEAYQSASDRGELVYTQACLAGSRKAAAAVGSGLVAFVGGDPAGALDCYDRALAEEPGSRPAQVGRAEALAALGRCAEALEVIDPWLDGAPDGWLIAAAAVEQSGQIDDFRAFFEQARERLAQGYGSPHRGQEHWAMQCRLLAYLGQPTGSRGVLGSVCAVLAGELAARGSADISGREGAWIGLLARNLAGLGRADLLARLLEPEALRRLPGVASVVTEVLGDSSILGPSELPKVHTSAKLGG